MKIYTRTGDAGTTGLFGGSRVEKDSPRVDAFGSVDELNASLGLARALLGPGTASTRLELIQADLFTLGAELACVPGKEDRLGIPLLGREATTRLEGDIDEMEADLPELKHFLLPSGTQAAATVHLCRAVCRRAERSVLAARKDSPVRDELVIYLNRLSDFLFVLARHTNQAAGAAETAWRPREKRGT
jgi:cob(I)alamin adenosyltransferase